MPPPSASRSRRLRLATVGLIVVVGALLASFLGVAGGQALSNRCGAHTATIVGTPGDDRITGTPGPDVIVGLGGNDHIDGGGGADIVCGGDGRDRLVGGAGRDHMIGGPGRDRLVGRAGNDVLLGGSGRDIVNGGQGRDRIRGGGGYDTCAFEPNRPQCERINDDVGDRPQGNPRVDRVIHVSFDGLRSDHVTADLMPALDSFRSRSASTLNARTDPLRTQTLPNHTSQFTGLPVEGGHEVAYNEDLGRTVHFEAGRYVSSVFDVIHDRGGQTALYVGKSKFDMIDRTWDADNGAVDRVGESDGRDKIDFYDRIDPEDAVELAVEEMQRNDSLEYVFFHIRYPDAAGHAHGWGSAEYRDAVSRADDVFAELLEAVDDDADLASTAIIVSSDHGGPIGLFQHADQGIVANYVVPLIVWAPEVEPGTDLYELNAGRRREPGISQPPLVGRQPIRTHEIANLTLDLLGHPPIPGSIFNLAQDLRID